MNYNEHSMDFELFFNKELKKFSDATSIKFSDSFAGNLISKIGNTFNYKYTLAKAKINKNDEKAIRNALTDTYSDSIKDFSKTVLQNTLYQKEPIDSNFTPPFINEGCFASKIENDPEKFNEYVSALYTFINNISIAYIKEHDLSIKDNPRSLGMDEIEFSSIIAPIKGDKLTNMETYISDSKFEGASKSANLISELENAYTECTQFDYEYTTDDEYTDLIDSAIQVANNHQAVIDKDQTELSDEDELTIKVENFATAYTALRENYQKKNFFQKWFTKEGWNESKMINSMRNKMMNVMGYVSKDKFNDEMKHMSDKPTMFTKKTFDVLDDCHTDFIRNQDDIVKDVTNRLSPKKAKQIEINEKEFEINTTKNKTNEKEISNPELDMTEIINKK